jgi:hypothetical protein
VALCAAMLFGIAAASIAADAQAKPALQPAAVLTVISGDVLMRTARTDFSAARDGAVLYAGTTLRTSADARALITLFEGSTMQLDPASDITIEAGSRDGSTIAQALGRSWNVVMRLTTADSRYEPTTPAATASVRGGDFAITASDAASGLTTTGTTEQRVPTTVAVLPIVAVSTAAKTVPHDQTAVAPARTTTMLANSAPVSMRTAIGAPRIRTVNTETTAARAQPVARSRERAHERDRDED